MPENAQPGMAPQFFDERLLHEAASAALAETLPGAVVLACQPLCGGISAWMALAEVRGVDGQERKIVLRGHPGVAEEFHLLRALRAEGISVPEVLGLSSHVEWLPGPLLIMKYVDGQADFAPRSPAAYGQAMGQALASIHHVPLGAVLPLKELGVEDLTGPRRPAPPGDSFGAEQVWQVLESAGEPPRFGPVLQHGDFWPGNVLWDGGRLAAVIDWEDAGAGDPLADLAITRLDLRWIIGREAEEAFTEAYIKMAGWLSSREDFSTIERALAWWDLAAILRLSRMVGRDLNGWAEFFHPFGREDITGERIRGEVAAFTARAVERLAGR